MNSINNIAIIMDGNGRWARRKLRPRSWGHIKGSSVVIDIVEEAAKLGVQSLTLYAFSTENWSRPKEEIKTILKLLKRFLLKNRKKILEKEYRLNVIGNYKGISSETVELIDELTGITKDNKGLQLNIAFNYGGRQEIIHAIQKIVDDGKNIEVTEEMVAKNLYEGSPCDIDLLIRTGGDNRISNFLLWQSAYAEIVFTKTMWPEFSKKEFREIIEEVSSKERRFGSLDGKGSLAESKSKSKENLKEFYE